MLNFSDFLKKEKELECLFVLYPENNLNESTSLSRYSVEVNYRTNMEEVLDGWAKILLGFVSAGMKKYDFHIKHVYTESPIRILVSNRNWDDGEWVGVVFWNKIDKCFVISKGFYNKDRKTVSVIKAEKCKENNAADITKLIYNVMKELENAPDRHKPKLKPIPLKRGPKK